MIISVDIHDHPGIGNNLLAAICHGMGDVESSAIELWSHYTEFGMFKFNGTWYDYVVGESHVRIFPAD